MITECGGEHEPVNGHAVICPKRPQACTWGDHAGACSDYPWTISPQHGSAHTIGGRLWVEVGISGICGPYEGIVGEWNGTANVAVMFTRQVVERIAVDTQSAFAENRDGQMYVITMQDDGSAEARMYFDGEELPEERALITVNDDGLYGWGALMWDWDQLRVLGPADLT